MAISTIDGTSAGSTGTIVTTGTPQSGSVIQVVQATSTTQVSTTSSSFVTTGLTVSITPKFSTSKIAVIASLPLRSSTTTGKTCFITIYRNSTNLGQGAYSNFCQIYSPQADLTLNAPLNYVDSPATTSSTSYTIYFAAYDGQTSTAMNNSITGVITLMEIAG